MRIGSNDRDVTIFAGQQNVQGQQADPKVKSDSESKSQTIFAGDSNLAGLRDRIAQRKAQAREQAMKVVGDTFAADRAIDDDMEARREKVRGLKQEKLELQREIDGYNAEQERLKGVYGVADDSEEQKNLELLLKCNDPRGGATIEEKDQAEALRAGGLTEYQSRVLEIDDKRKPCKALMEEKDALIKQENATIEEIHKERLKKDPMVNAQKQADAILKAASDEIVGMVLEDAREHVDEESEKREEQGEKIKEERKEQEELIEKRREKREEQEELLEDMPVDEILHLDRMQTDVKQEVQDILNKMKLVAEDIKGAAVDETL